MYFNQLYLTKPSNERVAYAKLETYTVMVLNMTNLYFFGSYMCSTENLSEWKETPDTRHLPSLV